MSAITFRELKHGLVHLLYPHLCEGCSKPLLKDESVLCLSCALELPETGYHNIPDNETAMRFAGRVPFSYATSYAYFNNEGLLQHLLHGLKYKGKKENGYYLGQKLGQSLRAECNWVQTIDVIIPVPLHRKKQAKRGYNQSELIAKGLGDTLKIPVNDRVLLRTRNTDSQTKKTRTERVNNMADAFAVTDPGTLAGKHILLIDDVLTTGATMEACALALMGGNDVKISLATIGIAVS